MNSGGGVSAFDSPDLYYDNLYKDQAILHWSPGADSYVVDISDDSGFSNIVDTYSGALSTKTFTGLSADTRYWVRCKAQFSGFDDSAYREVNFYTQKSSLVAAYIPMGLEYNDTNDFGTMGSTSAPITSLKSVIASGPLLSRTSGTFAAKILGDISPYAYAEFSTSGYADTASDIALGTGAFTIIGEVNIVGAPGSASQMMCDAVVGGNRVVRFGNQTGFYVAINNSFSALMTWPSTLPINQFIQLVVECDSTTIRASFDNGATWTNTVARPSIGNAFNLNRMGASSTGGNALPFGFKQLRFYTEVLTQAERDRIFDVVEGSAFVNAGLDLTKQPTNLPWTFITDPVDNYITAFDAGSLSRGGLVTKTVWSTSTHDYFTLVAPIAAPDYGNTTLFIRNRTTGKIHTGIDLGHYATSEDIHERPSIHLISNALWIAQMRNHYDFDPASLYIRKFWENFNFLEIDTLPLAKRLGEGFALPYNQYPQPVVIGNKMAVITHVKAIAGNNKGRLLCSISDDGGQSWGQSFTLFYDATANVFVYPCPIEDNNKGKCNLILEYVVSGVLKGVVFFDTTDFITWANKDGTYSKNVVTGGFLTTTEIFANGTIIDARASTNTSWAQGLSTNDDMIYGVVGNATATALQLFYQLDGSAKVLKTISFSPDTVLVDGTAMGTYMSAYHRSIAVAVYRGSGQFDVVALQINSGNWTPTLYRTLDWGDTWAKVGVLPGIDTGSQHYEFEVSHSYHANGDKGTLMATKATSLNDGISYVLDVDEFDNI